KCSSEAFFQILKGKRKKKRTLDIFHCTMMLVYYLWWHLCFALVGKSATFSDGSLLARFRNLSGRDLNLWWITQGNDDEDIRFFGNLPPHGGSTSFTTYVGHEFFWSPVDEEDNVRLAPFFIRSDQVLFCPEKIYTKDNNNNNDNN
ncbi:hypothetical protein RFI_17941, partial [Reticulomyxa filosa]